MNSKYHALTIQAAEVLRHKPESAAKVRRALFNYRRGLSDYNQTMILLVKIGKPTSEFNISLTGQKLATAQPFIDWLNKTGIYYETMAASTGSTMLHIMVYSNEQSRRIIAWMNANKPERSARRIEVY